MPLTDEPTVVAFAFVRALESGDFETLEQLMADDFTFTGLTPSPLDRPGFLELEHGFHDGVSDLRYEPELVARHGDDVELCIRVSALHTGELLGHPPTGIRFSLPKQRPVYTVRSRQIAAVVMPEVPGAGVDGILRQISSVG